MALIKTSTIDQITIEENGIILYRTNNVVMDGDKQLAQGFTRTSLVPNQDLTEQPANVVAIANLTWTLDVISAYQASLQTNNTIGA